MLIVSAAFVFGTPAIMLMRFGRKMLMLIELRVPRCLLTLHRKFVPPMLMLIAMLMLVVRLTTLLLELKNDGSGVHSNELIAPILTNLNQILLLLLWHGFMTGAVLRCTRIPCHILIMQDCATTC
jgi:hypothetical protein